MGKKDFSDTYAVCGSRSMLSRGQVGFLSTGGDFYSNYCTEGDRGDISHFSLSRDSLASRHLGRIERN